MDARRNALQGTLPTTSVEGKLRDALALDKQFELGYIAAQLTALANTYEKQGQQAKTALANDTNMLRQMANDLRQLGTCYAQVARDIKDQREHFSQELKDAESAQVAKDLPVLFPPETSDADVIQMAKDLLEFADKGVDYLAQARSYELGVLNGALRLSELEKAIAVGDLDTMKARIALNYRSTWNGSKPHITNENERWRYLGWQDFVVWRTHVKCRTALIKLPPAPG